MVEINQFFECRRSGVVVVVSGVVWGTRGFCGEVGCVVGWGWVVLGVEIAGVGVVVWGTEEGNVVCKNSSNSGSVSTRPASQG